MARLPLIFHRPGDAPRRVAGAGLRLTDDQRRLVHMASSLLLDYPGAGFAERAAAVEASLRRAQDGALAGLPPELSGEFRAFLDHVAATPAAELEADYVATFDLKRKCCLYLTYFQAGDTRKRGAALVSFIETYRAAGWEFDADELPDFLPAVLEFSARSDSPEASELIAAHRDGLEVLREALEKQGSPWAGLVRAVCRSLPELDDETR
ncbi:MAG TPA: nitrate reductase molybdenum cofactor assembly chaperone, partial [Agromyces sp.]